MMSTPRKTPKKQGLSPQRRRSIRSPKRTPAKTPAKNNSSNNNDAAEEGITVAFRMRPLNQNEGSHNRVWKVLPKYNSVAQTTKTGKPLPERVAGRTFFTFDKTFNETVSTGEVYDSVAKDIVSSVVSGLNGTIFAYGQTSSGKTYTMQGSGSIMEGASEGSGGIVHMAANDIFNNITKAQDRIFLVRASFLEIYNEEVRDLLSSKNSPTLQIREDPRRGVFVQSKEEIVTDFASLLGTLFQGENNRQFASTAMNERSSRSHTIFRITIESRKKSLAEEGEDGGGNENQVSEDDGAVLVSTLNLVDLAGSESVRHTGATGDRQKEGGMINTSLLTLSRVIVALGAPNQTHINFRDSKLTRILQPSLSGNARMAVICCATPSELYLEETRSTLAFASRAKLVKTRAQVNEVLDDRSIIRRLQRELAEARKCAPGSAQNKHVKALEQKADAAGDAAKEAEDKLDRLKRSILNSGVLFGGSLKQPDPLSRTVLGSLDGNIGQSVAAAGKRRRRSEGALGLSNQTGTPDRGTTTAGPHTTHKTSKLDSAKPLSSSSEIDLLRVAINAKNSLIKELNKDLASSKELLLAKQAEVVTANGSITELQYANEAGTQELHNLSSIQEETETRLEEEERKSNEVRTELERSKTARLTLEEALLEIRLEKQSKEEQLECEKGEMMITIQTLHSENGSLAAQHTELQRRCDELEVAYGETTNMLAQAETDLEQASKEGAKGLEKISHLESQLNECNAETGVIAYQLEEHRYENQSLKDENVRLEAAMKHQLKSATDANESLVQTNTDLKTKLDAKEELVVELSKKLDSLSSDLFESSRKIDHLEEMISNQLAEHNASLSSADAVKEELSGAQTALRVLKSSVEAKRADVMALTGSLESVLAEIARYDPAFLPLQAQSENGMQEIENLSEALAEIRSQQDVCTRGTKESLASLQALESKISQVDDYIQQSEVQFHEVYDALVTEKGGLESRLQAALGEKDALCASLENSQDLVATLREQATTQQAAAESQLATVSKMNELLGEGNDEKKCLVDELASLREQLEGQESVIRDSESQIQVLGEECESARSASSTLKKSLEDAENCVASLESALEKGAADRGEAHSNFVALSQDLAVACNARDEAEAAIKTLETKHQEFEALVSDLTSNKAALETESEGTAVEIEQLRSKISDLELVLEANEQLCKNEMDKTAALEAEREALETRLLEVTQEQGELTASREAIQTQAEGAELQNHGLQEELNNLTALNEETSTSLQEAVTEKNALEIELESAVAEIETMGEKISDLEVSALASEEKIATASEMLASLESANVELQALQDLVAKELEESTAQKATLVESLEENNSMVLALEQDISQATKSNADLTADVASTKEELSIVSAARDDAFSAVSDLEQKQGDADATLSELIATKTLLETEAAGRHEEIHHLSSQMQVLQEALEKSSSMVEEKSESVNAIQSQKEELENRLQAVTREHGEAVSARDGLTRNLGEAESRCQTLEEVLSTTKESNNQEVSYMDTLKEEFSNAQNSRNEAMAELETLRLSYLQTMESLEHSKTERTALETAASETALKIESMTSTISELTAAVDDGQTKRASFEAQLEDLTCSKVALEAKNGSASAEIQLLSSKICELELALEVTDKSLNEKNEDLSALKSEKDLLEAALQSSTVAGEDVTRIQQERDEALASLRATIESGKSATQNLQTVESEKSILEDRLKQTSQELSDVIAAKNDLQDSLKKAEARILGLEAMQLQLETNEDDITNELLQEARNAALAADDELAEKEKELQTVLCRLSQCEEELQVLLEDSQSPNLERASDSELQEKYGKLEADYEHLAETLGKERVIREESEKELKRTMGEEQRLLIQEAETRMTSLRARMSELEKKLTESEAEAYAAREANEKYRDHAKRSEREVTKLNSEITVFKEETLEMNQNKHEQEAQSNTEITRLVSSVNTCKAELYAIKQANMDLTERLRMSTTVEESSTREASSSRERAEELEGQLQALEEQHDGLNAEMQKLKANIENDGGNDSALKLKLNELNKKLAKKNDRIEKLEKTKLTKDQVLTMKRLKREHAVFKEKLKEAENEVVELRAHSLALSSDSQAAVEIQRLNFDNKALEKKLRKFMSHCQTLEDDKERIIDTLASSLSQSIPEGDITGPIISLCDQYASLQERCESLNIQLQSQQNSFSRVKELEGVVSSLRSETEELRQKVAKGKATNATSNDGHQVKYLEQENLQLMLDLKGVKQQLQASRTEVNNLRLASLEDSPTSSHRPLSSSDVENIPPRDRSTKELSSSPSSSKENLTVQSSSSDLSSEASTKKRRSSSTAGTEKTPKRNRRFPRLPGSSKKLRSSKSSAPGLGEASRADSEKAPECNQS